MRNTSLRHVGIFTLLLACFFLACSPCRKIDCVNGECTDGLCVCTQGYEGTLCESRMTLKYAGDFSAAETCSGSENFTCSITENESSILEMIFNNLHGAINQFNYPVTATVNVTSPNNLTIASQPFGAGTISGSGSISADNNTITLAYTIVVAGNTENCTAVFTRN